MSSDFLSQDEFDALLRGVSEDSGEAETDDGGGDAGGVRPYNLATQERIVRARMPTMEVINERFARFLRIGLFNYMRRNVEISVGALKVQKYSEFVRNLVVPTNLNLINAKPLRGIGLVVFDPNLVFLVVDNMFGGDGRFHTRVEGRDFTATEQRIIIGMLDTVFSEYARAWAPVYPLKPEYLRSEMNSQFANIATPSEMVVSTVFTVELGGAQAEMHICFPYSMLEPIRETLYSSMQSDHITQDKRWTSSMTRQLKTAEIKLTCQLGAARVTLRDIVNMRIGDVIPIHVPALLQAEVDGVTVFEGHHGIQNGQYAIRVERVINPEDNLDSRSIGAKNG